MYQRKLDKDIRCPLEYGLEIFGGKWNSRIICVLAAKEVLRYSEIRKEMGNITDAVLASALKELILNGIVLRKSYDEIPPRVEYCLSEKGASVVINIEVTNSGTDSHTYQFYLDGDPNRGSVLAAGDTKMEVFSFSNISSDRTIMLVQNN